MSTLNLNDLNAKREKLAEAKKILKERFIGLDKVIDQIISNIEAWYLLPEVINRPVIINLWGLTGVGKTDLVRRLVKALGFSDKYLEIQLDTKTGTDKSMKEILLNSNIEEGVPGIILLDEVQRFRTIDDDNSDIFEKDYQDVWMLLSDGKFDGAHTKAEIATEVLEMLYSKETLMLKKENEKSEKAEKSAAQNPLFDDDEGVDVSKRKYKISTWRASRFKKLLRLKQPIDEIMTWDEDKIYDITADNLKVSATADFEVNYSKCLVFISGNIDEAYKMAGMVDDADISADILHNYSTKLNVIDIKKALVKRFKPEQISRFGNTHILYPSLSSDNYTHLIVKNLNEAAKLSEEVSGVKIVYDKQIVDFIYRNGVFPAQGVRPVFSTINSVFNNTLPKVLLYAKEKNLDNVSLTIKNNNFLVIEGCDDFEILLTGSIDNIKKEIGIDKKTLISIHEAGHAVVFAKLFGVSPQEVKSSITTWSGGYVIPNEHGGSKKQLLNHVIVSLAGRAAETKVFGETYESSGAKNDIKNATSEVMMYLRQYAFGDDVGSIMTEGHPESYKSITELTSTNLKCEAMLKEQIKKAQEILTENESLFKEVCDCLVKKGSISPIDFQQVAKKHGLDLEVIPAEQEMFLDYYNKWEKFND